jgi:hypothetical protein
VVVLQEVRHRLVFKAWARLQAFLPYWRLATRLVDRSIQIPAAGTGATYLCSRCATAVFVLTNAVVAIDDVELF